MKRDVIVTFILSAFSTIAALACLSIVGAENRERLSERLNSGFTVSDEEFSISAAGWLALIFGFAAILSLIVALIMYGNDKTLEESLKEK